MKNKFIAICFCLLALILALIFCDMQLEGKAASENGNINAIIYQPIAIGRDYYVDHGTPDDITVTDYGSVIISMHGHLYETGWSNVVIQWK